MTDQLDTETVTPAEISEDAGVNDDATDGRASDGASAPDVEPVDAASERRRFWHRRDRVSKWDRPPDPHDWRFFVGNLGKILIATGLLLFGFVAYQLWGTGIETARAQNRLEGEFEQLLAEFADEAAIDESSADGGALDPAVRDEPPARIPTERDRPAVVESSADPEDADDGYGIIVGDVTDVTPIAFDLSEEAVVQDPLPQPFRGDPLFRLEIPAIGRDDIVVAGVSLNNLKDGPGHYPDTPLPGQLGNSSIAGHRTTYGAPFFDVDELRVGDELITTLANGDRFVYEVTFVEIVRASDYHVVTTFDPNIAELTLTSCHPKYTARDRIVVHSVLNPAKSSNVGLPTFYELEPDDEPIPGDDPVLVAEPIDANDIEVSEPSSALADEASADDVDTDDVEPVTDDAPAVDEPQPADGDAPADDVADDDVPAEDAPADDVEPAVAAGNDAGPSAPAAPVAAEPAGDPIDAFSQGWFDDDEAWPQIALWGMLLTIISLLAYQVSKKTRHDSIGFLVGIAPFLVALYFFFQNVNRLLPPGI